MANAEAYLNLRNALNVLQKENQVESDAYQIASSALMKVIKWHRDSIRSYELEVCALIFSLLQYETHIWMIYKIYYMDCALFCSF